MGNKCGSNQADTDLPQEPKVTVTVRYAQGLPEGEWHPGTDRYLYFGVGADAGGEEFFTSAKKQNVMDPVWNEECELPGNAPLKFTVFQVDADGNASPIACATLDLASEGADSFNGELPLEADGCDTGGTLSLKAKTGDDYAPDGPPEFNVRIDNPKKKALGVEIDAMDPVKCFVLGIKKNTAFDIYNQGRADNKVEAGMFITGVEGPDVGSGGCLGAGGPKTSIAGTQSEAMEKILMKKPSTVEVVCRRVRKFRVVLQLGGKGGLGLCVPRSPVGNSLIVTEVKAEGPVNNWNQQNPDQMVEPWDRIIAVDGKAGTVRDLEKYCKAAQQSARVVLTLVRILPSGAPMEPAEADY
mmetsp:Transcript_54335/g.108225  ORF Transcript_54335/g.108225 Transcript_54335/m.108225 type:complete len:355 (-) Transcript_54335:137-1201(-)|eukprot:CAMPEP_0172675058 /NCGR_PEP_ID=MMETSP1074-20121228/13066_1 /TAXON_ID=2916 /ORGANISM="Ceratium fusus, Strain PA161109" /LENGTH=354 /DNA_ID=CAMNT_0013492505 /DNA_START=15 /DNA_END=1079 /DNA_ORIENTATION=+